MKKGVYLHLPLICGFFSRRYGPQWSAVRKQRFRSQALDPFQHFEYSSKSLRSFLKFKGLKYIHKIQPVILLTIWSPYSKCEWQIVNRSPRRMNHMCAVRNDRVTLTSTSSIPGTTHILNTDSSI